MISLDEFRREVFILSPNEGNAMRSAFINAFIDTDNEWYVKNIRTKRLYADGYFYESYLWDVLKKPCVVIKEAEFFDVLSHYDRILAMWDIHSSRKILVPNYWKFEKDAVISLSSKVLIDGIAYLPNDIYIFDGSMTWTLIATHESDSEDRIFLSKSIES